MVGDAEGESEVGDESAEDASDVHTIGTDIYFQCEVTQRSVFKLIQQVRTLETRLLTEAIDLPGYAPSIRIFIRSDGGDIYAGYSAMDHLLDSKIRIVTVADGLCASAGTLMLLGGRRRMMRKHSFVLIHQLRSCFWGKFSELRDGLAMCAQHMDMLKTTYTEHTKISPEKLKALMERDVLLTADECIEYGVVHSLV